MTSLPPPEIVVLEALAKGTLVLVAAWIGSRLARRRSAAVRHLIWCCALLGLLAVPLFAFLPTFRLPIGPSVPSAASQAISPDEVAISFAVPAPPDVGLPEVAEPAATGSDSSPGGQSSPGFLNTLNLSPGEWLLLAWLAGILLAVVPVLAGIGSLHQLRRHSREITEGPAADLLRQCCRQVGLARRVVLLASAGRTIPMTWGVFRPVVLLPDAAADWSLERLRFVLLHELAHVRRWDCLTQLLGRLACAVYWFHPLAWLAWARLRSEQERACDDRVLDSGVSAADYSEHLLAIVSGTPWSRFMAPVALAMGRSSRMEDRIVAILDPVRNRRPLSRWLVGLIAAGSLTLLVLLAPLGFSSADPPASPAQEPPKESSTTKPTAPETPEQAAARAKLLAEVRAKLIELYAGTLDEKVLTEEAIRGMVRSLNDRYSDYVSPEQLREFEGDLRGTVSGVGAQIRKAPEGIAVVTPLEDSPALKAGLRPDDVITAIDGKPTKDLTLPEAVKLILGKEGTAVKLRVARAGEAEKELSVTRAAVRLRTAEGYLRGADSRWSFWLDEKQKVGYLRVLQFGTGTAKEVREALQPLVAGGMKGLILDLRACPGGLLSTAVGVCELFLSKGVIVTTKGTKVEEKVYKADGKDALGDFPLVVLVDEQTASAAEIVAGALQDNRRALLLGNRTYGKGSVQSVIKLDEPGGALRLTVAYYTLPGGRRIEKAPGDKAWGVDPDDGYFVPVDGKQAEAWKKKHLERSTLGKKPAAEAPIGKLTPKLLEQDYADPQLAAALTTMLAKLTKGDYEKVGKTKAAVEAMLFQRDALRQKREEMLKNLDQLDKELANLDKHIAGEEKKPPSKP